MHPKAILERETAHFSADEQADVRQLQDVARHLLAGCPVATPRALADKLQTSLIAPRWVCVLVAKAAIADQVEAVAA